MRLSASHGVCATAWICGIQLRCTVLERRRPNIGADLNRRVRCEPIQSHRSDHSACGGLRSKSVAAGDERMRLVESSRNHKQAINAARRSCQSDSRGAV